MSRLYLILVLFCCCPAFGQDMLSKYLQFAEEQYNKGDYYYALEYYQKAMDIDSNTIDILWKYAETLRAYKDYRKAEIYYAKVYDREMGAYYPASLLNLGLMQKQNGHYDAAIETFKKAKKKYYKDKKGYLYQKARREIESCLWAKSAMRDTLDIDLIRLPETVNTKNSEFGHGIYDGRLIFSSLRADSISENEEVYETHYTTSLYQSEMNDGQFKASSKIHDLFREQFNTGNGTFSLDGNRYYFSLCEDDGYNYRCKIMVANYRDGNWSLIDSLGSIINEAGSNTTMPCIASIKGEETLIFSSDRKDSEGGMDLFYCPIRNGNQYGKVRSIKSLNSIDNELTPWWDDSLQRLYFSSSWHDGFGGYDVFYSNYDGQFGEPVNLGLPYNSPANDLYYFRQSDTSYLTSNRIGVLYSKNPTCCSDIFAVIPPLEIIPPTPKETLEELNKRLPVTLYFHNDIPDPRSWDTVTQLNYINSYNDYTAMLDKYKKEYSTGLTGEKAEEAKEDIESFFIQYVDQGVKDLALFRDLLLEELHKGKRVKISIRGFASPLAKTDYNVNLTKRRISSLLNYLREYDNGVFVPYLDGTASNNGYVLFEQIPFGEYSANQLTSDNPNDVQNSVYSRAAAIERKIEIQSVSYLDKQEIFPLSTDKPVFNAGVLPSGQTIRTSYLVTNTSESPIEIDEIEIPCDCLSAKSTKTVLNPGESTEIEYTFRTEGYIGHVVKSVYVNVRGFEEKLRLIITTELR